jgi:hypothetical protein
MGRASEMTAADPKAALRSYGTDPLPSGTEPLAFALDPAAPAQLPATMPCRKACARRRSDISIREKS